jgi:arylsulfatase
MYFKGFVTGIPASMLPVSVAILSASIGCKKTTANSERPDIVVIMADDMGFSDLGCYGGDIPTPNLDRLAASGIRFSQFYNTSRSCPTRATLLTGLNAHMAGIGQMAEDPYPERNDRWDWGVDGYRGYLNRNCVTFAEVLKSTGYHTYMTGKWHVGMHGDEKRPLNRGFEKYYGILSGAASYFYPDGLRHLTYMNDSLPAPDSTTYYTTDAFTDNAIKFITEQDDTNPFILYLAYNAPHWPLHAKPEDIRKFVGKYMAGWDEIRRQRFQRQLEIGLFDSDLGLSERDSRVRPWIEVDSAQKVRSDYRMAVYAAQVYCMDYNIGRLLQVLEERGNLDNTLIIFLSDNGACAESYDEFGSNDDSFINRATFGGAVSYGIGWANVSNTPFFEYKVKSYEGGISAPLIVHWPARMKAPGGSINHTPVQLIDVMPTILDAAGAEYPETFHNGNDIFPTEGHSVIGSLSGRKIKGHEWMFWEHSGFCAVRHGDWKAYKELTDTVWQLYNLANDRMESHDISRDHPEMVHEMNNKWYEWANSHRVLPKRAAEKQ